MNLHKKFEVFGCVENREVYIGSFSSANVAKTVANRNLGIAKYLAVVIYEVIKDGECIINRECLHRLSVY